MVAFVQGAAVGAMIRGIPVANGQYAGGPFDWLPPFAILCGIGLVLGYALLGAGWLVLKSRRRVARMGLSAHPLAAPGHAGRAVVARSSLTLDRGVRVFEHLGRAPVGSDLPGAWGLLALAASSPARALRRDELPFALTVPCSSSPPS